MQIKSRLILFWEPNYLKDGSVRYLTKGQSKDSTETAFKSFLRYNLVTNQPPDIAKRLVKGPTMEIRSLGGSRRMGENDICRILFPHGDRACYSCW